MSTGFWTLLIWVLNNFDGFSKRYGFPMFISNRKMTINIKMTVFAKRSISSWWFPIFQFSLRFGKDEHLNPFWPTNIFRPKRVEHMGVSKNNATPKKWMVYFMENPMNKWMIWGGRDQGPSLFLETTPIWFLDFLGLQVMPRTRRL